MAAEPSDLTDLIAQATHTDNTFSNVTQAQAVAEQVNREFNGPQNAIRLLTYKLQLHQEVVSLQVLTVLEVCVKNCGQKFHTEIGRYKFLNELIKLLSPKYDADITPQSVKDRVTQLMFSWYVGLPKETKIGEAYKMLKQQGVILKDPIDPNRTSEPPPPRPQDDTVFSEQGNSELLAELLKSSNPVDLIQANKLIKSMVKQEEERLERVSKRIHELEVVSNNSKLLCDMIDQYQSNTPQCDRDVMAQLYQSCLDMRPELFRLAGKSADDKDDALNDILQASDELTAVIDKYKEVVLLESSGFVNGSNHGARSERRISSSEGASELLDLGFEGSEQTSEPKGSSSDLFLDELLGLDTNISTTQMDFPDQSFTNFVSQPSPFTANQPQVITNHSAVPQIMPQVGQHNVASRMSFPMSTGAGSAQNYNGIGAMRSQTPHQLLPQTHQILPQTHPILPQVPPQNTPQIQQVGQRSLSPSTQQVTSPRQVANNSDKKPTSPAARRDLLDFDVFSDFRSPLVDMKPAAPVVGSTAPVVGSTAAVAVKSTGLIAIVAGEALSSDMQEISLRPSVQQTPAPQPPQPVATPVLPVQPPPLPPPPTPPPEAPVVTTTAVTAPASAQDSYFVPLDAIVPSSHPPMVVLDKDGIKSMLIIAADKRDLSNKNVLVTIISTISTSVDEISNFNLQVAVPKSMRAKLQPASGTTLNAFNPILPPSSVTQVMLIANPNKEAIRMRLRINYSLKGLDYVDTTSIDNFPIT